MTISIVDKYPMIRSGLNYLLKDHFPGLTIIEAEYITDLEKNHPVKSIDLVIVGISQLPHSANLSIINDAKREYPFAKLIAYDEKPDPSMVLKYFDAGVNGYLSKQAPLQKLVDCIDDVLSLRRYISQEIMDLVLDCDCYPSTGSDRQKNHVLLSPREYEVAQHLIEGMTTSWIANKLNRKVSTVSTIKSHIFQKLKVDNIIKLREQIGLVGIKSRK